MQYLSSSVWLVSLSIITSKSIHVAVNGIISFFFYDWIVFHCIYLLLLLLLLFSCQVMSDSLQPHGLQHTRPPCSSPSPEVCPSSCPCMYLPHFLIHSSVDTAFPWSKQCNHLEVPQIYVLVFGCAGSLLWCTVSSFWYTGLSSCGKQGGLSCRWFLTSGLPGKSPKIYLFKQNLNSVQKEVPKQCHLLCWSIADLQCCVKFYCTIKWFHYTYTHCFFIFFSIIV